MPTIVNREHVEPTYGAMFSIDAIKEANRASGSHYFDADTMRFFGSRVLDGVIAGRLFITSERSGFDYDSPRAYSVREFMPDGSIETVGEFGDYTRPGTARTAAKAYSMVPHAYYFDGRHGRGGRKAVYVITAGDAWAAMDRLHANFRVFHMGHAADYMTAATGYIVK